MQPTHPSTFRPAFLPGIAVFCIAVVVLLPWLYTVTALGIARHQGLYASAEAGMLNHIKKGYIQPDRYQIIYAGTNSFDGSNPHVWYVIACVWGGTRSDGSPVGSQRHVYDQPGNFFLNTRDGWVFMSEGAFPGLLGFFMKVYGLAGPGSAVPSHDWGSTPTHGCEF
jgi:hypothetical protein